MSMFNRSGEQSFATVMAPPSEGAGATLSSEQMAAMAYKRGDKEKALEHYRDAARQAPTDAGVQKALADFCLVGLDRPDDAYEAYRRVLGLTPRDPDVLQILGNMCVTSQKFGEARQYFSTLAEVQPSHVGAKRVLAALPPEGGTALTPDAFRSMIQDAQRSMTDSSSIGVDEALDRLMQYKSRNAAIQTKEPGQTYEEICTSSAEGKERETIAALERFVAANPAHAAAQNDLGVLYYRAGMVEQTLVQYQKAVALEPRNITFRKNLADYTYVEIQDAESALRHYVDILTISPRDAETLLALAQVCIDMQKDSDALVFLDTLLNSEPWNQQAREMRSALKTRAALPVTSPQTTILEQALAAHAAGNKDESIRLMETHVRANPLDAEARNDLGVMYYQAGRAADAGAQYEEAARLDPANDVYAKNLADYYVVAMGRPEDALRIYVSILTKSPRDVDTLLGIGRICEILNRVQDAKDFYRKAVEAEPWNTAAREQLGRLGS
jgi:Flp pilus assembly protein TadD